MATRYNRVAAGLDASAALALLIAANAAPGRPAAPIAPAVNLPFGFLPRALTFMLATAMKLLMRLMRVCLALQWGVKLISTCLVFVFELTWDANHVWGPCIVHETDEALRRLWERVPDVRVVPAFFGSFFPPLLAGNVPMGNCPTKRATVHFLQILLKPVIMNLPAPGSIMAIGIDMTMLRLASHTVMDLDGVIPTYMYPEMTLTQSTMQQFLDFALRFFPALTYVHMTRAVAETFPIHVSGVVNSVPHASSWRNFRETVQHARTVRLEHYHLHYSPPSPLTVSPSFSSFYHLYSLPIATFCGATASSKITTPLPLPTVSSSRTTLPL